MTSSTIRLLRYGAVLALLMLGPTTPGFASGGNMCGQPECGDQKPLSLTRTFSPTHAAKTGASAVFEITYNDFLSLFPVGREIEIFLSPPGEIYEMDIGFGDLDNAQTWTAPTIPFGAPSNWTLVDPADTDFAHLFPGATHVLVSTNDQIREGTIHLFYSFVEAGVQIDGEVAVLPGEGGEETYEYGAPLALFPLNETMGFLLEWDVIWYGLTGEDEGIPAVLTEDVGMHGFGTFTFPGGGAAAKGATALPAGVFFDDIVFRDPDAPPPVDGVEEVLYFETYYSIFGEDGSWFSFYIADPPDGSPTPIDGEIFITNVEYWRPVETVVPVELTAFTATRDGEAALLAWQTASETNNAGFEIEWKQAEAGTWERLAFVSGHGTTTQPQRYSHRAEGLAPGRHTFRLKQIDFDGAFDYSPEVEVTVELAEAFALSAAYPNPFNPSTQLTLAVAQEQAVTATVYDAMGRQVQTLFEGRLPGQETRTLTFEADALPSGPYFVRVAGERFQATQQVLLVK